MKKLIFLWLLLSIIGFSKAQNIYPLHPSIGDTISLVEKLDYSLFEYIDNKKFNYAAIEFKKENFYLIYHTNRIEINLDKVTENRSDSIFEKLLSQEDIIIEQKKIEKVNAYYRWMAEEAKKKEATKPVENKEVYPIYFSEEESEKIKKEARMHMRLKEEARRNREFELGIRHQRMQIDFK